MTRNISVIGIRKLGKYSEAEMIGEKDLFLSSSTQLHDS